MTVTFCGHGKNYRYDDKIKNQVKNVIRELIAEGADTFLLGGYGSFDMMSAHAVKELKQEYPDIKSVLVIPYVGRDYDKNLYDCSEYPPIEKVPKRFAIIKRNEYMVEKSDVVIAYIDHNFGGAAKTFDYAIRKKKRVINIADI